MSRAPAAAVWCALFACSAWPVVGTGCGDDGTPEAGRLRRDAAELRQVMQRDPAVSVLGEADRARGREGPGAAAEILDRSGLPAARRQLERVRELEVHATRSCSTCSGSNARPRRTCSSCSTGSTASSDGPAGRTSGPSRHVDALSGADYRWWTPVIVLVDNYDSFTYNLAQYLAELGAQVDVRRNDAVTVDEITALEPEGVLISPGPGTPDDAGISLEAVRRLGGEVPLLGVCLGHQAIAQAFGGTVVRADRLMHGRTSPIEHERRGVFGDLPSPFTATRYHSLIVARGSVPEELELTAWTAEGEVMGLRHRTLPIEGVQFHPESFLTEHGYALLRNWLEVLPDGGRRAPGRAA